MPRTRPRPPSAAHYVLVADREKMAARGLTFGLAPKHPVHNGLELVAIKTGQVLPGERFPWYGDPDNPPRWASPTCEKGEAAYARQELLDARKDETRAQRKLMRKKRELAELEDALALKARGSLPPASAAGEPARTGGKAAKGA